jgi:AcrR family transcriptional regulator
MPRVIKPEEYQQKRAEILDAAQRLIFTKGYEQMSVQDILNALGISKGAFYHYFDSKPALLEALVVRMMLEAENILAPIAQDTQLSALAKLERFFGSVARWKTERRALMINLLHVWYADENAILRQKLSSVSGKWLSPFLLDILQQGVREGRMDPDLNAESAQVVVNMMMSMSERIATTMLSLPPGADASEQMACLKRMENLVLAYRSAIERVLGLPAGTVLLLDLDILKDWVLDPDAAASSAASTPV